MTMATVALARGARLDALTAAAYTVPTDAPESDGTFAWDRTTMVLVEARAGDETGLGYTYGDAAAVPLITGMLAPRLERHDPMAVPDAWATMVQAVRNLGRPGVASLAIAAVDVALWDLKARLLDVPRVTLLGGARASVPVYGSGGFTSYSIERLREQLGGWAAGRMPASRA